MSAVIEHGARESSGSRSIALGAGDGSRTIVFGDGGAPVPLARFLRQARALAARLPEATHAINLCEDRYRFLLAFCAAAVRGRAHEMLDLALDGRVDGWRVDLDRLPETARFVAGVIRDQYPDLKVPFHARWRHFVFGGRDLWAEMAAAIEDSDARARSAFDRWLHRTLSEPAGAPGV